MSLKDEMAAMETSRRRLSPNWVLLVLASVALAAFVGLDLASVAPNRIVPGVGHGAISALGWLGAALGAVLLLSVVGLSLLANRQHYPILLALVMTLLVLMPFALMIAGYRLIEADMPQARLGIGAGFWAILFVLLLALVELRQRLALSRLMSWGLIVPVGLLWWLCLGLWLEPLALMREYHVRSDQFSAAMARHIALVAATASISVVAGVAMALLMRRYSRLQKAAFGLLNFLQTVPSLALFGLLLAPLAWLAAEFPTLARWGVSGIGWAPALLALVAYSLLPMVRNTFVALEAVSPAVIEAARGMGMNARQVFFQVRLPLALPVLLEGLRITLVQAIGLTAVAALIGAGGLGTFIFQGLGQAAMDMVLLGALPILLMALMVDALLGAISDALRPGGAR
ncbi:ABC transporter permease [Halomonas sp. Bachu 37]|uniref:ABC transporter permease n=1 Tax=Halomonas kashgarensis TaxID=3084920 RepID=UPI003217A9E5